MKRFIFITFALLFTVSPAVADDDDDELYNKWYAGDWVSHAEDIDGHRVLYGLRIAQGKSILGCVIYPDKDGIDRKLFGEITDMGANEIEIRLSNGKEIELEKIGREPNNKLKLVKRVEGGRIEAEFQKEFLPMNCT